MSDPREPFASASHGGPLTPLSPELASFAEALAEHYAIERPLGEGGMASVFLAQDRKHGRRVAVKVVHPDLAAALGRERFLAEIRTTARLQHPHILPLLDSGDAVGLLYYVMPHVEGDSLRDRLDREKQLAIEDALRIASEVADALGYAHEHGIIHRDIKPENILLQGGHALVADFGIALAVQHAGGQRLTQTGLSLGTPQYMSPEQAMGERTIDARSDVYALAAVTYEMLTGEPPFTGASTQAVVAKLLTDRPTPPTIVRDSVPPHVEHAVLKALAKLPADRWPTTQRFAEALRRGDATSQEDERRVPRRDTDVRHKTRRFANVRTLGVTAAMIIVTAAIAWWLGRRSARPEPAWSVFTQLTDASGVETTPSLSPDGESFAYASDVRGTWDIYAQRVGGRNTVLIAGDSTDEVWPVYSPDGKQIAYAKRGDGIFVMGATGESARRLTTFGSHPSWSPDGRSIVFGTLEIETPYAFGNGILELWVVESSGEAPRKILSGGVQPAWSPSGQRIAFVTIGEGARRVLATIPSSGGQVAYVTTHAAVDWAPTWSPDGRYLYYASDRGGTMGLWRIRVDESSGRARGTPEPLAAGVDVAMDLPRISRDGSALVFRSLLQSVNPAAIDFDATQTRIRSVRLLQNRTGSLVPNAVSPDGEWIAMYNLLEKQEDIFVMRRDGSELKQLTNDAAKDRVPRFTPDGRGLTFTSTRKGFHQPWLIQLDGSGLTQLSTVGTTMGMVAPDGKRLLLSPFGGNRPIRITTPPWPVQDSGGTTLEPLTLPGDELLVPYDWSRTGRWLAGPVRTATGLFRGFAVYDFTTKRVTKLNDDSDDHSISWLPDERRVVYFTSRGKLVMQDAVTLARREITGVLPHPSHATGYIAASPDGRTLYYGAAQTAANIWMVRRAEP